MLQGWRANRDSGLERLHHQAGQGLARVLYNANIRCSPSRVDFWTQYDVLTNSKEPTPAFLPQFAASQQTSTWFVDTPPTPRSCFRQAQRFQIIKVRGERTEFTEEKEGVEEMELAATNSHSLEAWLSTVEVSFWFHGGSCAV